MVLYTEPGGNPVIVSAHPLHTLCPLYAYSLPAPISLSPYSPPSFTLFPPLSHHFPQFSPYTPSTLGSLLYFPTLSNGSKCSQIGLKCFQMVQNYPKLFKQPLMTPNCPK